MAGQGDDLRDRLVLAAVRHAASEGWVPAAIRAGAAEVGIDEVEARRLLRGGPRELFRAFNDWADKRMAEALEAGGARRPRLSERVERAVLARLGAMEPFRESVWRGVAFAALPQNVAFALACYARTVDRIWRAAGDRSHDFSFYTKRALLAGVLGATTLVWLDDRSEGGEVTRAFLRRRLADVLRIQKLRAGAERLSRRLSEPLRPPAGLRRRRSSIF